jgi:hypothetical protein
MDFDFDDADIDHDNKLNFQEFYRILSGFNGDSKDLDSLDDYYNRMTDHEFEELVRILNEDLAKLRITSARVCFCILCTSIFIFNIILYFAVSIQYCRFRIAREDKIE